VLQAAVYTHIYVYIQAVYTHIFVDIKKEENFIICKGKKTYLGDLRGGLFFFSLGLFEESFSLCLFFLC
jgi:hypothetical protein